MLWLDTEAVLHFGDFRRLVPAIQEMNRLGTDRVEVGCGGGRGRTGTALACLVAIDTGTAVDAVDYVRAHYDRHAVETPGQRRYVAHFLD